MSTATRGPGQPAIGPTVHVKLPDDLINAIDMLADESGTSRSAAIRALLQYAVERSASRSIIPLYRRR